MVALEVGDPCDAGADVFVRLLEQLGGEGRPCVAGKEQRLVEAVPVYQLFYCVAVELRQHVEQRQPGERLKQLQVACAAELARYHAWHTHPAGGDVGIAPLLRRCLLRCSTGAWVHFFPAAHHLSELKRTESARCLEEVIHCRELVHGGLLHVLGESCATAERLDLGLARQDGTHLGVDVRASDDACELLAVELGLEINALGEEPGVVLDVASVEDMGDEHGRHSVRDIGEAHAENVPLENRRANCDRGDGEYCAHSPSMEEAAHWPNCHEAAAVAAFTSWRELVLHDEVVVLIHCPDLEAKALQLSERPRQPRVDLLHTSPPRPLPERVTVPKRPSHSLLENLLALRQRHVDVSVDVRLQQLHCHLLPEGPM
mmetsp:Transcript_16121/g.62872  ORF Transcript_16121/g.62872 Transcript_16121/m.62872 type:complete len:373 (-) Transcript_16121:517-1635(-)